MNMLTMEFRSAKTPFITSLSASLSAIKKRLYSSKSNLSVIILMLCMLPAFGQKTNNAVMEVFKAKNPITIDGEAKEIDWANQPWHPIDQLWLGDAFTESDFKGRYKLLWRADALYLLAEITDDVLLDQYKDPLKNWWDDDCIEVFIDEDNSGGIHQFNHNAFAYHVALDGNVVDMSTEKEGKLYNSHVESARTSTGTTSIWELKIYIFDDTYSDQSGGKALELQAQKKIGFALAYCDNDYSEHRENFIGSSTHEGFKANQGWIDASIFGSLLLVE